MELRYFQIIIPLLALFFLVNQIKQHLKGKASIYETVLVFGFWVPLVILSFFPDTFSHLLSKITGIKSNVNAVIFFGMGVLFYFQFRLYKLIKRQDEALTELIRKIALDRPEVEQ